MPIKIEIVAETSEELHKLLYGLLPQVVVSPDERVLHLTREELLSKIANVDPVGAAPVVEVAPITVVDTLSSAPAPVRERGKPSPGKQRRTRAEVEEDEAAERAERDAAERCEQALAAGQEPDPEDLATVEGIGSKFAEEVEAEAAPAEEPVTSVSTVQISEKDTFWWDNEDAVVFAIPAGGRLPDEGNERYEEITQAQFDKAIAKGTEKVGAPAFAQKILAEETAKKQVSAEKAKTTEGGAPSVAALYELIEDFMAMWPPQDAVAPSRAITKLMEKHGIKSATNSPEDKRAPFMADLAALIDERKAEKKGR